jgi:anaerobic selenocysteine-containing dehydrogenase
MAAGAYINGAAYPEMDYAAAFKLGYDDPRYEIPECIVLWGKDPLPSNPDGFFGHAIIDLMKRGARLITIDPRVTWTSTRADYSLRLRPGTDGAMAMAWLNIIITEGLYDERFVDYWCYGFDELAERVAEWTPEKAEKITGVPSAYILAAARMYATAKPAAIQWGLAVDQNTNGMQVGQCIVDLMSITGNMDVPGGQLINAAGMEEKGFDYGTAIPPELYNKMIGLEEYPAYCGMTLDSHADMTLKALETGEPYALKMAFWTGCNLLACTSMEPKRWHAALCKSLEFAIGYDSFMTPSINATCDLVLPLKTCGERKGTVTTQYGATPGYKGFMYPAFAYGEGKSQLELTYELGTYLHPELWEKFPTFDDFLNSLRLDNKHDFEKIHDQVIIQQDDMEYYKYEKGLLRKDGGLGFNTHSGRIELYAYSYLAFNEDPLPYYQEPDFSPLSTPELSEEYPDT